MLLGSSSPTGKCDSGAACCWPVSQVVPVRQSTDIDSAIQEHEYMWQVGGCSWLCVHNLHVPFPTLWLAGIHPATSACDRSTSQPEHTAPT